MDELQENYNWLKLENGRGVDETIKKLQAFDCLNYGLLILYNMWSYNDSPLLQNEDLKP